MTLPDLPKKRRSREQDITPKVIQYFRDHYPYDVVLEIKVGNNKLLPHQEAALQKAQEGTFSWKIPDRGGRNPFDAFVLKEADAFVVTCVRNSCTAERIDGEETFTFTI